MKRIITEGFKLVLIMVCMTGVLLIGGHWWWNYGALPRWNWFEERTYSGEEAPWYPTFNLVPESESKIVAEYWFVGIREYDASIDPTESTIEDYSSMITLKPNHVYELRIDCFNAGNPEGNSSGETVARDVRLSVDLSKLQCAETQRRRQKDPSSDVYAYDAISVTLAGSDTSPTAVHDSVIAYLNEDLGLEFLNATLHNQGELNGTSLPRDIIRPCGTLLGVDQFDGVIPAGEESACFVTLRFRATASPWTALDTAWRLMDERLP